MSATIVSSPVLSWRGQVVCDVRDGHRLAGLFGTAVGEDVRITAVLAAGTGGLRLVDTTVPCWDRDYPALTPDVAAASWYERELHDLFGLVPTGHPRLDPLLLPGTGTPPRHVQGQGVFTIPHGPVRSGVVESVEYLMETPGEDILFPQVRAHYKHRGIERRFAGMSIEDGALLAERAEGVASVAHALAYCHAVEDLCGVAVPVAAGLVRVLHAELERVANHLDVAMRLADSAGLGVAVARFGWHKERVLRLVSRCCGNRFGRGVVVPGGVTTLPRIAPADLTAELDRLAHDIIRDADALMVTPSFLDRLRRTGILSPDLAATHGALGPIGRASGRTEDVREIDSYDGYYQLDPITPPHTDAGDAMARLRMRLAEIPDAFRLANAAVAGLRAPESPRAPVTVTDGRGIGRAEAPHGEVLYVVEIADGRITRCKPRSASCHNLPLFESVFGNDILTDYPFIEPSFGLSIAGAVL